MFDLITGSTERPLRERSPRSKLVAIAVHGVVLAGVVAISLTAADVLPPPPTMMVFFAPPPEAPPAPPPPAPPPAPAPRPAPKPAVTPDEKAAEIPAPVEAPAGVEPGPVANDIAPRFGVEGGVEGGVVGGVVGGLIGTLEAPPPPPPPPPAPSGPVRIGGKVKAPSIVHRVDPSYPMEASALRLHGVVILEATVDATGCVESVKVLRSAHRVLDKAAVDALRQWRYEPVVLNDIAMPFVLTVTFTFRLP
jgi:protein TonB